MKKISMYLLLAVLLMIVSLVSFSTSVHAISRTEHCGMEIREIQRGVPPGRRTNQTATAYNSLGRTASGQAVGFTRDSNNRIIPRINFGTRITIVNFTNGRQTNDDYVRIGTQRLRVFEVQDVGTGSPSFTRYWLDFWLPETDIYVRNFGTGRVTYDVN